MTGVVLELDCHDRRAYLEVNHPGGARETMWYPLSCLRFVGLGAVTKGTRFDMRQEGAVYWLSPSV